MRTGLLQRRVTWPDGKVRRRRLELLARLSHGALHE